MQPKMDIYWLDDRECQNAALVGSKAANLSRLTAEYRVPPGFCITAQIEVASYLKKEGVLSRLSENLHSKLTMAYHQLSERCNIADLPVAVRSSAADEDSAAASFAGQHETILNVSGIEAVGKAIIQCWASAISPRALQYREQHGLLTEYVQFSVLVQQMVRADVSAVVFSANPVTSDRDEVVINANFGLGESIVSGQITPDTFVVSNSDWKIGARHVADKEHMTIQAVDGIEDADVPTEQRLRPSLSDEQIVEIARLAVDLETEMGFPVDIECAYQGGHLYLLQCRPITTLQQAPKPVETTTFDTDKLTWDQPNDAELTWSSSKEIVLPLQQSISLYYYQGWAKAFREAKVVGGLRARYVCGYEYQCWEWTPTLPWPETEALQQDLERQIPSRWRDKWLPTIQSDLDDWRAVDLATLANDELAVFLHDMLNRQLHHWEIHACMGSLPSSAVQRLVDWYLDRFPDAPESEPYQLLQGQSNRSVQINHHLWTLSQLVTPDVEAALRDEQWTQLPDTFRTAFESHLERFGLEMPDKQKQTARLLLQYVENEVKDPYADLERLATEREGFTAQIRAKLNPDERATFETLLDCALDNHPLIEDHNFWLDQQSDAATHRVTAEFARRLVEHGSLERADDVEYLTLYDLLQWGFALVNPLRPLVSARKTEYERYRHLKPPEFLGKPPQPTEWVDRYSGPPIPLKSDPGTLRGVGASAGLARGPARVAKTLDEALTLKAGEILVCPATDPTWTPLFGIAAALVTEAGGSLSHAAIVAREYRLPAVVGTHFATVQIYTGQMVEVDGERGIVSLLND